MGERLAQSRSLRALATSRGRTPVPSSREPVGAVGGPGPAEPAGEGRGGGARAIVSAGRGGAGRLRGAGPRGGAVRPGARAAQRPPLGPPRGTAH